MIPAPEPPSFHLIVRGIFRLPGDRHITRDVKREFGGRPTVEERLAIAYQEGLEELRSITPAAMDAPFLSRSSAPHTMRGGSSVVQRLYALSRKQPMPSRECRIFSQPQNIPLANPAI
jgi:hypothetical protein